MLKKIIAINGTGASGKDTFINMCKKYVNLSDTSSVFKVKQAAKILGWSGSKSNLDRKFLADLKDLSTKYNDLPYKDIENEINKFYKSDCNILFVRLREPEEIKRLVSEYNAISLLIRRKNHRIITSNEADKNVENYNYDYVIENDSLNNLDKKAQKFIEDILNMNN